MDKPKVSIIVPVYNAEDYLRGCIASICAQTLKDWELILINDGSKDHSGAICDEFAEKDPRIRVIHKENGGVSKARNTGLAQARGEYIGFVDADDTVVPEMFERLYHVARQEDADIVMCDAVTVYADGTQEPDTISQLPQSATLKKGDWTPSLLKEMAGSACRCIYRSDLIRQHGVIFPIGQKFSEDRVFNLYLMGYAKSLYYLKEPFYRRLMWEGSTVHRFHASYFEDVKQAAEATEKALQTAWKDDPAYQKAYLEHFVMGSIAAINNYFYKTSPWKGRQKRQAVRALCNDAQLRTAIEQTGFGGIRGKWILKKRVCLLSLCAMVLNKRAGR